MKIIKTLFVSNSFTNKRHAQKIQIMNIFKKSKKAKVLATVVGLAAAFTLTAQSVAAAGLTQAQIDAILGFIAAFDVDQATINNVEASLKGEATPGTGGTTGTCTPYTFSRSLSVGDTGADVKALQVLLNTDVATQVAATGIGSAGEESEYFGSLTKAAVIKFQNLYAPDVLTPIGLTAGTGYVGSMSLAKLNELSVCEPADDTADVTGFGTAATFTLSGTPVASDYVYITLTDAENVVQCAADVLSAPAGVTLNSLTDSLTTKFDNCANFSASSDGNVITVVTTGASFEIDVDVDKATGSTLNVVGAVTEAADDTADDTTGDDVATGPVSVSAATSNPTGGALIGLQSAATIAAFEFKGTGTLESVTLTRSGISDQNALTSVYLYDGDTRLTDGYSFNTNSTLTMSGLNLAVTGSRVITVKADVKATPTTDQATIVATLTSFTADGVVSEANVSGGTMQFASGTLASAALSGANSPAVDDTATVNAGTSGYTFWSQSLQVNTRALTFSGANFRMIGSAPSDALSDIKLYVDGVDQGVLASVISIGGVSYISFDMSAAPLTLATGSHLVDVRATIEKGSNRTIQLSLQQAADLTLTDGQMGVNIAVTVTGSGTLPRNAGTVSINTGSVTVAEDVTFKSLTNVTGGATGVTIGKYTTHAYGEDVKVSSLSLTPSFPTATTPYEGGLQNVTLYFNGSQIGSSASWASGAMTFQLGSQLIIPAGVDSTLEVRADLRNATSSTNYTAGTVDVTLNAGSSNAQGQNSYATLDFPTAAVDGTNLTMQTGTLAASKNTGYSNQSVSPSTAGVKIGSYVLQNQSSSESVRVTTLSVAMNVVTMALTDFSALTTSETSNPVQPAATNTFSTDFVLAPGETRTVDIFANTGSATGTASTTLNVTYVGVTSGISSTSGVKVGQTITVVAGSMPSDPTLVTSASTVAQLVAAAGGASDGSTAVFNVLSTGGDSTIKELKFTVTGTSTVTSVTAGGKTASVIGTTAYLTGLNIDVPAGISGTDVEAKVNYSDVGTGGITSTTTSAIVLTYVKYDGGNGQTATTTSVAAPTMVMVGSKPVFSVANMDSEVNLISGQVKVAEVTVTADSKGNIKLGSLPISITSTGGVTVGSSTVPVADEIVVKVDGAAISTIHNNAYAVAAGGTGTSTIVFGADLASAYNISAGTSKTFEIYVTAANVATAGTDALTTSLGSTSLVQWFDVAGDNSTAIDATSVYDFPTNTSTIDN